MTIRVDNVDAGAKTADFHAEGFDARKIGHDIDAGLEFGNLHVEGEAVGTGDAVQTVFNLAITKKVRTATVQIFEDSTEKFNPADFSVDVAGVVTFVAAPASGKVITANYTHDYDTTRILVPGTILDTGADIANPLVTGQVTTYPKNGGGVLSQALGDAKPL